MTKKKDEVFFIGIDPGISGAIAIIDITGKCKYLSSSPFEEKEYYKKGKKRTRKYIDTKGMNNCLLKCLEESEDNQVFVSLEKVHAFPGQGVTSSFRFGESFGAWQGVVSANNLDFELTHPKTWRNSFEIEGDDYRERKNNGRLLARKLFPEVKKELKYKKYSDRADALLMAEHKRREYLNGKEEDS